MASPIRPTNDDARDLASELLHGATFGALAVNDPDLGLPFVSRVAVGADAGAPLLLVSSLSQHTAALEADPGAALLLGEPGPKGDPLTHPRLTIQGRVALADKATLKADWIEKHPKSALYYDFGDFRMLRLIPERIFLNGGFGKAFILAPDDLTPPTRP